MWNNSISTLIAPLVILTGFGLNSPVPRLDDGSILASMAQRDSAEILMGQLAMERGQSTGVKAYGRMLMADHRKHLAEVRSLATRLKLSVGTEAQSTELWGDHQRVLSLLSAAEPAEFDGMLADAAFEAHAAAILQTREEDLPAATNPGVKALLQRTLGSLSNHEMRAKALRRVVISATP